MNRLWSTSSDRITSRTGRSAGMYRSSEVAPLGYLKVQSHFAAVTSMS